MLNNVTIMGRITKDIELRRTNDGTPVASFTIACEKDFKGKNGEKETDFIDVVAWKNTAEFVDKYFAKGRMAVVSGRLQIRTWKDKDGNNRRTAEVNADNVYFGDSKKEEQENRPYVGGGRRANDAEMAGGFAMLTDDDAQLPF